MSCKPLKNMNKARKTYLTRGKTYFAKQVLDSMRSHATKYHRAGICTVTGERLKKTKPQRRTRR